MSFDRSSQNSSPSTAQQAKNTISSLISRNVTVSGHRTSVRLEPEMWHGIMEISRRERASIHEVCTAISQRKGENTSLTAAIRVFIMAYFRNAANEEGHSKAGHGRGLIAFTASLTQMPSTSVKPLIQPSYESTRAL